MWIMKFLVKIILRDNQLPYGWFMRILYENCTKQIFEHFQKIERIHFLKCQNRLFQKIIYSIKVILKDIDNVVQDIGNKSVYLLK